MCSCTWAVLADVLWLAIIISYASLEIMLNHQHCLYAGSQSAKMQDLRWGDENERRPIWGATG